MATKRVRTHSNPLSYVQKLQPRDWEKVFPGLSKPLHLEIGFGKGVFLRHYAAINPDKAIIGVEVRQSMVALLESKIDPSLKNAHLIHGTGDQVLRDLIPDQSLAACFIFHPDPWVKKRHQKRRILSLGLIQRLHRKLKDGGKLYLSTDMPSLWIDMEWKMSQSPYFKKIQDLEFWEKHYQSHWDKFSQKDQRNSFRGVFEKAAIPKKS